MEGERFASEQPDKKLQSPAHTTTQKSKRLSKLQAKRARLSASRASAEPPLVSNGRRASKSSGTGGARKYKRRRLEDAKRRVIGHRLANLSQVKPEAPRPSLFALSIPAPDFDHLSFEHDPHNQLLAQTELLHCMLYTWRCCRRAVLHRTVQTLKSLLRQI